MKKFGFSVLLTAALFGFGLNSCDKDSFTEEDAMNLQAQLNKQKTHEQDSLNIRNQRVTYTVNIVDASTSTLKSGSVVSAISGAVVKLVQDTMILTKTVDASGVASFANLRPGQANVNISLNGYSEVNYTVNISTSSYTGSRMMSNIIPLIPVTGTSTGTIKGKVVYESDLTNLIAEPAANVKVLAMVDVNSDALPVLGNNGILSISYDNLSLNATTDSNGEFTITVPATLRGLDYDITIADFTVSQKLLQTTYHDRDTFGVLTIPTSFGSSFLAASNVDAGEPVVVTIGAPDYSFTEAAATAIVDNKNSIASINVTNNGGLYAEGTNYTVTLNDNNIKDANTTLATATFDVNSYGRVNNVRVTSAGQKYLAEAENFEFTIPYVQTEAVMTITAVNGTGGITAASLSGGKYYINNPQNVSIVYNNTNGSGAVLSLSFSAVAGGYQVNNINWAGGNGSGYAVGETFNVKVISGLNQQAKCKLHLSTGNVSGIFVSNQGANYLDGQVDVIIGSPAIGTTATATATVSNGKISTINITNSGTGYTTPPTVKIVNKAERIQAKYEAIVSEGKVTGFNKIDGGNGYLSVPAVTLTSAIPGAGSGAKAEAVLSGGKITSLTLINTGSNYRGNSPAASKDFDGPTSVNVKGSTTSVLNFHLGTGRRSIEQ